MGYDDELTIPIGFQIDTNDLEKMKSSFDAIQSVIEQRERALVKEYGRGNEHLKWKDKTYRDLVDLTVKLANLESSILECSERIKDSKAKFATIQSDMIKNEESLAKLAAERMNAESRIVEISQKILSAQSVKSSYSKDNGTQKLREQLRLLDSLKEEQSVQEQKLATLKDQKGVYEDMIKDAKLFMDEEKTSRKANGIIGKRYSDEFYSKQAQITDWETLIEAQDVLIAKQRTEIDETKEKLAVAEEEYNATIKARHAKRDAAQANIEQLQKEKSVQQELLSSIEESAQAIHKRNAEFAKYMNEDGNLDRDKVEKETTEEIRHQEAVIRALRTEAESLISTEAKRLGLEQELARIMALQNSEEINARSDAAKKRIRAQVNDTVLDMNERELTIEEAIADEKLVLAEIDQQRLAILTRISIIDSMIENANKQLNLEEVANLEAVKQENEARLAHLRTMQEMHNLSVKGLKDQQAIWKSNVEASQAADTLAQNFYKATAMSRTLNNSTVELPKELRQAAIQLANMASRADGMLSRTKLLDEDMEEVANLSAKISEAFNNAFTSMSNMANGGQQVAQFVKELQNLIAGTKYEVKDTSDASTTATYKMLRESKMIGSEIEKVQNLLKGIGDTAVGAASKAVSVIKNASLSLVNLGKQALIARNRFKELMSAMKSSKKHSDNLTTSLKKGLWALVRYTIGVRTIYALIGRLRRVVVEVLGEMAKQIADVNKQMSSLATSLNYMKASVGTAVQPLLNVLAPALERIADLFAKATYWIGSFFAALTGQSVVYKATKKQIDYAASLDKSAQSAKDLKEQLSGLDKLNVLRTQKDNGSGEDSNYGWEESPLHQDAVDKAEKMKKLLEDLFSPLKKAWEREGKFVMDSWKYALNEVKKLIDQIGKDFITVWKQEATVKIFEDVLHILGDIGLIIGHLARNFREAWAENDRGLHILEGIRDIIGIIVHTIRRCADLTVEWADRLSFKPLFDAILESIDYIKEGLQDICDLVVVLFQDIILDGLTELIQNYLPRAVKIFGKVVSIVGTIAKRFNDAWTQTSKYNNELTVGQSILSRFNNLFNIVFTGIEKCVDITMEWAKQLDFTTLLVSTERLFGKLEKPVQTITDLLAYLWNNVILKFQKFIIEEGLPRLENTLSNIIDKTDWDKVRENGEKLLDLCETLLELGWNVFADILGDIAEIITTILESKWFGGFLDILNGLADWCNDHSELVTSVLEALIVGFVGLKGVFGVAGIVFDIIEGIAAFKLALMLLFGPGTAATVATGSAAIAGATGTMATTVAGNAAAASAAAAGAGPGIAAGLMSGVAAVGTAAVAVAEAALVAYDVKKIDEASNVYLDAFDTHNRETNQALENFKKLYEEQGPEIAAEWAKTVYQIDTTGKSLEESQKMLTEQIDSYWDDVPQNLWEGFRQGWDHYFGANGEGGGLIGLAKDALTGFVDSVQEFFGISSPSVLMAEIGGYVAEGFFNGLEDMWNSMIDNAEKLTETLLKWFDDKFNISTLVKNGADFISGLQKGFSEKLGGIQEKILSSIDKIKEAAKKRIDLKTLASAGKNLVTGLWNGFKEKFSEVKQKISDKLSEIKEKAREVFKINSPSKVFYEIGEYISEGLGEGVEDGAKDVSDAFEDLIPEDNQFASFETQFVDMIARMTQESTSLFDVMIDSMNDKLANLNVQDSFGELSAKLREVSKIDIPKIAAGFTLPTDINVNVSKQNSSDNKEKVDLSDLPDMLYDAFVEALSTMPVNNNGDIVVEIDGKSVFTAVRSQNDSYKKRTGGVSAFA